MGPRARDPMVAGADEAGSAVAAIVPRHRCRRRARCRRGERSETAPLREMAQTPRGLSTAGGAAVKRHRYVRLEQLLGQKVVAPDGATVGRLEEVRADRKGEHHEV